MIAHNPGAASPFLFLGDHAGRAVPADLKGLGLSDGDSRRHIAWDIGVDGVGRRLSAALCATFIAQTVSRLVIDCNRAPERNDAICETSDGTEVPGNRHLTVADRRRRVSDIFEPYHAAIAAELDRRHEAGLSTIVVALHSFTPTMAGLSRPWRFGVLHMGDSAFSRAVLARLQADLDPAEVGDNAPYQMDETDFTVPHHAIARGLDYLELEIRQDLVKDAAGEQAVAEFLGRLLPQTLQGMDA